MARLVEWHDDHARGAECVRFRSAVRRRRLREWLRCIPCQCQRPVLLYPAKEEILVAIIDTVGASSRMTLINRIQCNGKIPNFLRNEPPNPAKYHGECQNDLS